jgi:enoyl-CoA hydratase/carnithine racemase
MSSITSIPKLSVEQHGRIALVTISNPEARNALTRDIFEAGLEAFRAFRRDEGVRAIVLRGEGEHFSGGGNLDRMVLQRSRPRHTQAEHLDICHAWLMAMRECPQPIIAAVEGAAAGGGFAIALACDLVVAAENATMVMSHAKIGLSPDCGASYWLARALPHQLALEMMLDPSPIAAARLQQLGLVNKVVGKGMAVNEATKWAEKLANGPAAAYGWIKKLTYAAASRELRVHLDAERDGVVENMYGAECAEGISAFREKRPARF